MGRLGIGYQVAYFAGICFCGYSSERNGSQGHDQRAYLSMLATVSFWSTLFFLSLLLIIFFAFLASTATFNSRYSCIFLGVYEHGRSGWFQDR